MPTCLSPAEIADRCAGAGAAKAARPVFPLAALGVLWIADLLRERYGPLRPYITRQALPVRWAFYLCAVLTVLIFGIYGPSYSARAFAYFQF